eukprot:7905958-Pyramimonas_sp.AAC.1
MSGATSFALNCADVWANPRRGNSPRQLLKIALAALGDNFSSPSTLARAFSPGNSVLASLPPRPNMLSAMSACRWSAPC